jgi:hypothetical protein
VYSDVQQQTYLMGFLYSPRAHLPIVWSVARSGGGFISTDPITLDYNYVNAGGAWNSTSNRYLLLLGYGAGNTCKIVC